MTQDDARKTLENAYLADVVTLAARAAKRIKSEGLTGDHAAEAVFDLVAESERCRNVGQAIETLIFSDHDRAIMDKHTAQCGCLDWSEATVWSHFAAHALTQDVITLLAKKHGVVVTQMPAEFRPHGSPHGMVS